MTLNAEEVKVIVDRIFEMTVDIRTEAEAKLFTENILKKQAYSH